MTPGSHGARLPEGAGARTRLTPYRVVRIQALPTGPDSAWTPRVPELRVSQGMPFRSGAHCWRTGYRPARNRPLGGPPLAHRIVGLEEVSFAEPLEGLLHHCEAPEQLAELLVGVQSSGRDMPEHVGSEPGEFCPILA